MDDPDVKTATYWLLRKFHSSDAFVEITYGEGISAGTGYDALWFPNKDTLLHYAKQNNIFIINMDTII